MPFRYACPAVSSAPQEAQMAEGAKLDVEIRKNLGAVTSAIQGKEG